MLEIVLGLSIVLIPLLHWRQTDLVRMIPLIIVACLILIGTLILNPTLTVFWDAPTIAMLCFGLWLIFSMIWTDSHQSAHELYAWIAYLFLCYVSRYVDTSVILGSILAVGTTIAGASTYYRVKVRQLGGKGAIGMPPKISYIFGNSTHNSTFDVIPLFISLWAVVNVNPLFILATAVLITDIWNQRTRGTFVGVLLGIMVTAFLVLHGWWLLTLLIFPAMAGVYVWKKKITLTLLFTRFIYWVAAFEMLRVRYLFGYGLNMFRKQYPELNPKLFKNDKIRKLFEKCGGVSRNTGHRPHNDFLDIAIELGIFGLIVFCSIFAVMDWSRVDPIFIGAMVAYAGCAMFFFPLREVHTALPFWCFAGMLMGRSESVSVTINPFIAIVLGLLIGRVIWAAWVKFSGLYFYDRAMNPKYADSKIENIGNAIGCDPYNSNFLMYGVLFNIEKHPDVAFEYALRHVSHFDGGKVKWGVYDQFARTVLRLSGLNIAELYTWKALSINPEFDRSKELLGFIHQTKEKMAVHGVKQGV